VKLLVITSRVPWPLEKGDKLRIYHQLRELAKTHEIILVAINDQKLHLDADTELRKFCSQIHYLHFSKTTILKNLIGAIFNRLPFQVAYFWNPKAQMIIDEIVEMHKPDRIYCQLIRTTEYVKRQRSIPKILDYMDTFSKGVERRIPKVAFWKRPLFRIEWKRLLRYESTIFNRFESTTIISEQDRKLLPVFDTDAVTVIPNGVDTDFFFPQTGSKTHDVLFNGNMQYPPNIESAQFLVREIMPLVWKQKPQTRVLLSGADPSAEVLSLKSERVTVTGWVEDVRTSFSASQILVAPMQSSIGLQNKLLEAMAMGIPCITSPMSNNALQAIPNEQILVAETAQEYAHAICQLLDDQALQQKLTINSLVFVREKYSWAGVCENLNQLIIHAQIK
jgi:polysaccharide biosynthesis protein PslH